MTAEGVTAKLNSPLEGENGLSGMETCRHGLAFVKPLIVPFIFGLTFGNRRGINRLPYH